MRWWMFSLLLCTFGFFREFRPSEPFLVQFLTGEWWNITSDWVNREFYPIGTYSYLAQLVVVFLVTDIFRYKIVIVASACCGIGIYSTFLWMTSMSGLMASQAFYGTFMASEVAYFTYMYAKVDRSKYQRVTGHTRAAILGGRFLSAVLAQILVSTQLLNIRELFYISLAGQCVSVIAALVLPSVRTSIYFYTAKKNISSEPNIGPSQSAASITSSSVHLVATADFLDLNKSSAIEVAEKGKSSAIEVAEKDATSVEFSYQRAFSLLWLHFKSSYSNGTLVTWSVWWAFGMCAIGQIENYNQMLWHDLSPDEGELNNGITLAVATLLGALSAYCVGVINHKFFDRFGIWLIVVCSGLQGGLVLAMALTDSLIVAYVTNVLCVTIYNFLITVASSEIAKIIDNDCFALVFGFNTFVSLGLSTVVTVLVVSGSVFLLDIQSQFMVYAAMYIIMAVAFLLLAVGQVFVSRRTVLKLQTS